MSTYFIVLANNTYNMHENTWNVNSPTFTVVLGTTAISASVENLAGPTLLM
jgi:hypothetical protein